MQQVRNCLHLNFVYLARFCALLQVHCRVLSAHIVYHGSVVVVTWLEDKLPVLFILSSCACYLKRNFWSCKKYALIWLLIFDRIWFTNLTNSKRVSPDIVSVTKTLRQRRVLRFTQIQTPNIETKFAHRMAKASLCQYPQHLKSSCDSKGKHSEPTAPVNGFDSENEGNSKKKIQN